MFLCAIKTSLIFNEVLIARVIGVLNLSCLKDRFCRVSLSNCYNKAKFKHFGIITIYLNGFGEISVK